MLTFVEMVAIMKIERKSLPKISFNFIKTKFG
jgi:hypothetical protein